VRSLSAEERALWARVASTIRPLSRERVDIEEMSSDRIAEPAPKAATPVPAKPTAKPASPVRPGTTLDGTWDRKISSGNLTPDRVLDLHGHSLDSAWRAIDDVLERAIDSGDRVVLLITGHQRRGDPPVERGKIRAAVHDWLAASRHAGRIASVRGAHVRHGGGGSLYIILRRG
jgi:DNA-nicking Smr family endonuclease